MTKLSPADGEELKPLSKKHQMFVDQYFLANFNGTEAYMRVYKPKGGRSSARVMAAELLAIPNISAALETRLAEVHMSADEALELLADIARGDMAQLMDVSNIGFNLDMKKAQKQGLTKLIKKVKQKTTTYLAKKESEEDREVTELEIELYDSLAAIRDVLKVHGRFADRVEVNNTGAVTLNIVYKDKPNGDGA